MFHDGHFPPQVELGLVPGMPESYHVKGKESVDLNSKRGWATDNLGDLGHLTLRVIS